MNFFFLCGFSSSVSFLFFVFFLLDFRSGRYLVLFSSLYLVFDAVVVVVVVVVAVVAGPPS